MLLHLQHICQKWRRNCKAAVLVEFAFIGIVVILTILLLFETTYCYVIKTDLERQLKRIVRQSRTNDFAPIAEKNGQMTTRLISNDGTSDLSQAQVKAALCQAPTLGRHCENITVQRRAIRGSASNVDPDDFKTKSCEAATRPSTRNLYDAVKSGDLVIYSVCYPWYYITPISVILNRFATSTTQPSIFYAHAVTAWRKE